MESQLGYNIKNKTGISVLAFADDIIITARTPQVSYLLGIVKGYLKGLDMRIAAAKCTTFAIKSTGKDSWYFAVPGLILSGDDIPYADADTILKYLRVKISP